ncbi:hypothetical protein ACS0TY_027032 [Phlomoides rotata]
MEVKPTGDKSRKERRKEARLAKNQKKFDSWVQHQSKDAKKLVKNNGASDCAEKSEIMEKSKTKVRDLITNRETEEPSNLRKSEVKKGLKRKKGSSPTPKKGKFFELLEMDMKGSGVASAEEDLRMERRLAKKLKLKNGRLNAANDDLDMMFDGIPSVLDNVEEFGKVRKSATKDALPSKSKTLNSVIDDSEEEISSDKGDEEESDSLAGLEEDEDDEISSDEIDEEESDSLATLDEDEEKEEDVLEAISAKDTNKGKRRKTKIEEHVETENRCDKKKNLDNSISNDNLNYSNLAEASGPSETHFSKVLDKSPKNEPGKYVAPHLRSHGGNESAEHAQARKRVRGLLNRLSETNVESITGEISALFHSVGRAVGSQILSEEVVASCSGGPRGNEQYAAVFAAFVAGMACLVGIDFGAKLLACLATSFEEEYLKEDNLSLRNLTLLLSYLYVFGVCSSELIYDFLIMLGKRLTEVDVSTVLTVLQCCGMKLRGDDPVGMNFFIHSVQSRMEFMIDTICDIKNNKKRSKEDTVQHTRIKKWLQKLRVDDILIRELKWGKLVDPNKKGQWWLSGDIASNTENIEEVAGTIDKEIPETKKMLELAASQRMNTDARRAIFCVIMSGEDYIDAFEKLLRLDLPGKQDREIMRVLVECCLQEKVFNKYYCVLASKLCSHDKNHKFTLQYCLWDHFKELESTSLIRSMHLSKFIAEMVASFTLSLAVLKAVDFSDPTQLTPKRIMHFRMLFEAIFKLPDKLVWNIFTRIAVTPEYESLRRGIEFFISKYIVSDKRSLGKKFKIAKKALSNIEGIVM